MIIKQLLGLYLILLMTCCVEPQRDCVTFKNGTFTFTTSIDEKEATTTFVRNEAVEIDYFKGGADTSTVRWINKCEYIVKKLHPKNKAEEKSIHMKILSTTDNSYTFEYSIVGDTRKSKGTAILVSAATDTVLIKTN